MCPRVRLADRGVDKVPAIGGFWRTRTADPLLLVDLGSGLDESNPACHSRGVKSCWPSGSQDLAFLGEVALLSAARLRWGSRAVAEPVLPALTSGHFV
jgi:hypothetical protein